MIYAGQGVHWAEAWTQLRAARRAARRAGHDQPRRQERFPETHPLSLGSGGVAMPKPVHHFLDDADVIFGIGCSFTETNFGVAMPKGKTIIHATLDPNHLNKDVRRRRRRWSAMPGSRSTR